MRISGSISSWSDQNLAIEELNLINIDRFHIDIFEDLEGLPGIDFSQSPIQAELHVVSANPTKFTNYVKNHGISRMLVQWENLDSGWSFPMDLGCKFGLSVLSQTNFSDFEELAKQAHYLTVMATTPGISGRPFDTQAFAQIQILNTAFPDKPIHVDGGVTPAVASALKEMGVKEVVLGSALSNTSQRAAITFRARYGFDLEKLNVSHVSGPPNSVPILTFKRTTTMHEAISEMDKKRRGYLILRNQDHVVRGVLTDGDIRRLYNSEEHVPPEKYKLETYLDRNPKFTFARTEQTVLEAFLLASAPNENGRFSRFMPVLDRENGLAGLLDFDRLNEEY